MTSTSNLPPMNQKLMKRRMSLRGFLVFLEIFIILDVAKSFPVQQEGLDGASVKNAWEQSSYIPVVQGNKGSGGMGFQKTTPNSLFSCFDLDICRTGLDFCNERRKACEKCEDYEHTCGSNIQPVGCTKYCVDLLVAKKLQEIEEANTSVTSEKTAESKEKSDTRDIKWIVIIGIMGLIIIVLVVIIGWRECKRKQSATKEKPETQLELLGKDVETPVDELSQSYSSVPPQSDKGALILPIPSAPSMLQEISDPDQTKPKMNKNWDKCLPSTNQGPEISDLSRGRQQQADEALAEKKNSAEIQQREVGDELTSSGYSSTLSTPSHSRSSSASVTNNITINLNPNVPNVVSKSTSEETTLAEDPNKNIPFGKQESGKMESAISLYEVPYKNQLKPVSDENKFTQIALRDNTIDFTDDKNKLQKINVT